MSLQSENNKRIAKNTLLLYFRMLLSMCVSLYTSRVVLNALGVEDYGIYNVVGGVVSMFSIISGSLSSAISRFITFELGKGNLEKLKRIFSTSVTIQIFLSLIILIIAELLGIWFLNYKMNIPEVRLYAANYVFQLSIITFILNLISVPYNALIIAHERMSAFAYISIIEVTFKLIIAFLITISPIDKLIFFAIMHVLVAFLLRCIYIFYCKKNFKESNYKIIFDKTLFKQMFGFAGWNLIGSSSAILRDQGGNIIINLFCGPTVNAARGIAYQVNSAINGFVNNFMMAINPQIIKSYASGNNEYMMNLIFQGARLSYYILFILSLPVIVNTHFILSLWLGMVPEHTILFIRLVLIFTMSESISNPLITVMLATGKIRNYQIIVGGLQMLNLPLSYVLLKIGCIPETILIVAIFVSQICLIARLIMLQKMVKLSIKNYFKKVYINIVLISIISSIPPFLISSFVNIDFKSFIILSILCIITSIIVIYFIGCNKNERLFILSKVHKFKAKIFK